MPITHAIDLSLNAAFAVASVIVTDEEVIPAMSALYADPRFHPDMRHLADYSQVTKNHTSGETLSKLARISKFSPRARRAILVKNDLEFGLLRVFQSYVSMQAIPQLRVFRDRSEAVSWLNEGVEAEKHIK